MREADVFLQRPRARLRSPANGRAAAGRRPLSAPPPVSAARSQTTLVTAPAAGDARVPHTSLAPDSHYVHSFLFSSNVPNDTIAM